jgi:hypothetical protein
VNYQTQNEALMKHRLIMLSILGFELILSSIFYLIGYTGKSLLFTDALQLQLLYNMKEVLINSPIH